MSDQIAKAIGSLLDPTVSELISLEPYAFRLDKDVYFELIPAATDDATRNASKTFVRTMRGTSTVPPHLSDASHLQSVIDAFLLMRSTTDPEIQIIAAVREEQEINESKRLELKGGMTLLGAWCRCRHETKLVNEYFDIILHTMRDRGLDVAFALSQVCYSAPADAMTTFEDGSCDEWYKQQLALHDGECVLRTLLSFERDPNIAGHAISKLGDFLRLPTVTIQEALAPEFFECPMSGKRLNYAAMMSYYGTTLSTDPHDVNESMRKASAVASARFPWVLQWLCAHVAVPPADTHTDLDASVKKMHTGCISRVNHLIRTQEVNVYDLTLDSTLYRHRPKKLTFENTNRLYETLKANIESTTGLTVLNKPPTRKSAYVQQEGHLLVFYFDKRGVSDAYDAAYKYLGIQSEFEKELTPITPPPQEEYVVARGAHMFKITVNVLRDTGYIDTLPVERRYLGEFSRSKICGMLKASEADDTIRVSREHGSTTVVALAENKAVREIIERWMDARLGSLPQYSARRFGIGATARDEDMASDIQKNMHALIEELPDGDDQSRFKSGLLNISTFHGVNFQNALLPASIHALYVSCVSQAPDTEFQRLHHSKRVLRATLMSALDSSNVEADIDDVTYRSSSLDPYELEDDTIKTGITAMKLVAEPDDSSEHTSWDPPVPYKDTTEVTYVIFAAAPEHTAFAERWKIQNVKARLHCYSYVPTLESHDNFSLAYIEANFFKRFPVHSLNDSQMFDALSLLALREEMQHNLGWTVIVHPSTFEGYIPDLETILQSEGFESLRLVRILSASGDVIMTALNGDGSALSRIINVTEDMTRQLHIGALAHVDQLMDKALRYVASDDARSNIFAQPEKLSNVAPKGSSAEWDSAGHHSGRLKRAMPPGAVLALRICTPSSDKQLHIEFETNHFVRLRAATISDMNRLTKLPGGADFDGDFGPSDTFVSISLTNTVSVKLFTAYILHYNGDNHVVVASKQLAKRGEGDIILVQMHDSLDMNSAVMWDASQYKVSSGSHVYLAAAKKGDFEQFEKYAEKACEELVKFGRSTLVRHVYKGFNVSSESYNRPGIMWRIKKEESASADARIPLANAGFTRPIKEFIKAYALGEESVEIPAHILTGIPDGRIKFGTTIQVNKFTYECQQAEPFVDDAITFCSLWST